MVCTFAKSESIGVINFVVIPGLIGPNLRLFIGSLIMLWAFGIVYALAGHGGLCRISSTSARQT